MASSRQTRFIADLRGKHEGEEIWIIGCGQSLDDFPDEFFDNKISIALNWAILAFPDCTYWHGHHEAFREYLRDEKPEFLWKSIILYPFAGPFRHGRVRQPADFFGELTSRPIWMRFRDIRPIPRSAFEQVVENIVARRDGFGYIASMSVAHTAIEAAMEMGAKRVTLVGCEHQEFRPGGHARRAGMPYRIFGSAAQPRIRDGTRWLAELLGEHGIEVARYYYKTTEHYEEGYERIV